MADQNCAHGGCKCKVEPGKGVSRDGKLYCSDHCANAGTVVLPDRFDLIGAAVGVAGVSIIMYWPR